MSSAVQFVDPRHNLVYTEYVERGVNRSFGSGGSSAVDYSVNEENLAVQPFVCFQNEFLDTIVGANPSLKVLTSSDEVVASTKRGDLAFAHEAGVWFSERREVFFTSNQLSDKGVVIFKYHIDTGSVTRVCPKPDIPAANGACRYKDQLLVCCQGNDSSPSGLVLLDPATEVSTPLINNFMDRPFNSPNDVIVLPLDGSIWFTDPDYGIEQGLKSLSLLPNQVYCLQPDTGDVRVVANELKKPNGICFSPDNHYCYITDTETYLGTGGTDPRCSATIYEYEVVSRHGSYILLNKRVFAFADTGAPDGIKCDVAGNVYAGCSDGIHIWNPAGILVGKILVPGGIANFCFIEPNRLFLLNETRLITATLAGSLF
ncbi:hypothetical protein TRICI_004937 [Trichomonascus ciferrii]|uniref:SMP-30/Gluconolactonase/LRE-like region domain-containing protein n=1 Tax=Trichomonascus ciferrii TaxID=44093 RepID=A0A642V2U8_9ASCO|nr:hypothetical protein TRICI_004937 [Trichomonascus ciferrii]